MHFIFCVCFIVTSHYCTWRCNDEPIAVCFMPRKYTTIVLDRIPLHHAASSPVLYDHMIFIVSCQVVYSVMSSCFCCAAYYVVCIIVLWYIKGQNVSPLQKLQKDWDRVYPINPTKQFRLSRSAVESLATTNTLFFYLAWETMKLKLHQLLAFENWFRDSKFWQTVLPFLFLNYLLIVIYWFEMNSRCPPACWSVLRQTAGVTSYLRCCPN